jgi:2'-5' RNA ligase
VRLFTAIALPPELAHSLSAGARALVETSETQPLRIRWSRPDDLHLTLFFLGEVPDPMLDPIRAALSHVAAPSFPVELDRPEFFRRAGALVVSVVPQPALLALAASIPRALASCGFAPESRPYRPHITLARLKGPHRLRLDRAPWARPAFRPGEFHLYRSHLGKDGARYEILASYKMAGGSAD